MNKTFRALMLGMAFAVLPCLSHAQAASATAAAPTSMIDQVKQRGVLIAGVKTDAPPFGFIDENGKNAGFEIDLITDLARRLGVKVKFVPAPTATRIQLLEQGRVDLLIATVSHYRSRNKVVDFSIGYLYTPQTLMVKKGSDIKSLADLAGKRVGAAAGSDAIYRLPAISPKTTVQSFPAWPDAFFALSRGLVDAIATDTSILQGLRKAAPDPDDYVVLGAPGTYGGDYYAIAVRQNDSKSLNEINFLLQDQWLDGTWQRAFDKWLGKDSKLKLTRSDFGNFKMTIWSK
jgi:polar amino acid transport system substrate-binding protein